MVNADATNKWYNESEMKLDHIINAIGIIPSSNLKPQIKLLRQFNIFRGIFFIGSFHC
jgi:hypothetical protein